MDEFIKMIKEMQQTIEEHDKKIKVLESKKTDFNIWNLEDASKIVGCCRQTFSKMIKSDKILKKDIDYYTNGTHFIFSKSSLENLRKGKNDNK